MNIRSTAIVFLLSATPAAAHFGHLGDLAGHGHWIALGAAVAAGAIAAALVKRRKSSEETDDVSSDAEEAEDTAS